MRIYQLAIAGAVFLLASCSGDKEKTTTPVTPEKIVQVPVFNADSAYAFIQKQVDFGPRIPNTSAHRATGDYLVAQLKQYGATVVTQTFQATTFDGKKLDLRNIIASFNPDKPKRILLAAHWDTRPFSDKDKEKPNATFDGANDGASGVGVLLEIARLMKDMPPTVGVDIIFFDGEDWGERHGQKSEAPKPQGVYEWWCLGSQHWAQHKHKSNYTAYFGILLDMVGGKNARFAREGYSEEYAPSIVSKVWKTAARIGHANVFINQKQGGITDDHVFVNEFAKIPMIDIISYDPATGDFGDFHHTQQDNMDLISKETLLAVGQTVLQVVYHE